MLQLSCNLGGMKSVMRNDMQGVAADGNRALFFMLPRALPLLRGELRQFSHMLGTKAIEGRQGLTQGSLCVVAFSRPPFLVVGGDHRVSGITHQVHASKRLLFSVTQVTDNLDD